MRVIQGGKGGPGGGGDGEEPSSARTLAPLFDYLQTSPELGRETEKRFALVLWDQEGFQVVANGPLPETRDALQQAQLSLFGYA